MTAPTIGTVAMINPVSPDARCCSAMASRIHGIAISRIANANTGRHRRKAGLIASLRCASTSSTIAAIDVRPNTTIAGSSWRTATRMSKYGIPQMNDIATNNTHPRFVIPRCSQHQ